MLPLSDGLPARRFPVVNVLLIVANFAVWLFYEFPHLNSTVYYASFNAGLLRQRCPCQDRRGSFLLSVQGDLIAIRDAACSRPPRSPGTCGRGLPRQGLPRRSLRSRAPEAGMRADLLSGIISYVKIINTDAK